MKKLTKKNILSSVNRELIFKINYEKAKNKKVKIGKYSMEYSFKLKIKSANYQLNNVNQNRES